MKWFEAVGALEDQLTGVVTGPGSGRGLYQNMPNGGYVLDYGEDLSSVMKDLF